MSVRERFEALAGKWDGAERPAELLASQDWQLLQLFCWHQSRGAKAEGVSAALTAYVTGSKNGKRPDWFDRMLRQRDSCSVCGETYRVGNLGICTDCERALCYGCDGTEKAPNGNQRCPCGGEIVG